MPRKSWVPFLQTSKKANQEIPVDFEIESMRKCLLLRLGFFTNDSFLNIGLDVAKNLFVALH